MTPRIHVCMLSAHSFHHPQWFLLVLLIVAGTGVLSLCCWIVNGIWNGLRTWNSRRGTLGAQFIRRHNQTTTEEAALLQRRGEEEDEDEEREEKVKMRRGEEESEEEERGGGR